MGPNRDPVVIPGTHDDVLSEKQLINYKDHRVKFLTWMLNVGKQPSMAKGYSPHTVYATSYRTATFDKWCWENFGGYSMPPSKDEAKACQFVGRAVPDDPSTVFEVSENSTHGR